MGVREERIRENTKHFILELNLKHFKELGYWLRTIKEKLKKFDILKIRIVIDVDYLDDRGE